MINKHISFKVKQEHLNEAEALIADFLTAIHVEDDGSTDYRSFQSIEDPQSFVHVLSFKDSAAEIKHRESMHYKYFVEHLYPLCKVQPTAVDMRELHGVTDLG